MRHVAGTHRVDLDWHIDRINLDPGIQINAVNTNQQFAYIPNPRFISVQSNATTYAHQLPFLSSIFVRAKGRHDVKMQCWTFTASATAKQRLVRNFVIIRESGGGQLGRLCCQRGTPTPDDKSWEQQPATAK